MRHIKVFGGALLLAAVLLPEAPVASADVPPPPDYKESCAVEKKQGPGEVCEMRGAHHGDPFGCGAPNDRVGRCAYRMDDENFARCCPALATQGWHFRCKTRGASVFSILLCRPRRADAPAPAPK